MSREALVLVVVFFVLLAAYAFLPRETTPLTTEDVEKLLLEDLKKQGITEKDARFTEFQKTSEGWSAVAIISLEQHSPCPKVEKRIYSDVLKFKYRPDKVIEDCRERIPITLREEALINSAKLEELSEFAGSAFGCGFSLKEFDDAEAREYCPSLTQDFLEFIKDLPEDAWAVQWSNGMQTILVALDSKNNLLKMR